MRRARWFAFAPWFVALTSVVVTSSAAAQGLGGLGPPGGLLAVDPKVIAFEDELLKAINARRAASKDKLPPIAVDPKLRAFARIEHTLDVPIPYGETSGATSFRLPPIVAAPRIRRPERPLAAVYLNPHFRDPRIAAWIEAALAERGLAMHAVGEGFAGRP